MTTKLENARRRIATWWSPRRRITDPEMLGEWRAAEDRAILVNARWFFGLAGLAYLAHVPLVDQPLHLAPESLWLSYRLGLAGLCSLALVLTLPRKLRSAIFLRTLIIVVGAAMGYLQSNSMLWSPIVPYVYSVVLPTIAAPLLRAPVGPSVLYLWAVIALEAPLLIQAGVPGSLVASGTMVATVFVAMLRTRLNLEVTAFLAESEVKVANENLRKVDAARTRFFANVNHELRTPLMLIVGPLERLLATPDATDARPLLDTMAANAERLLRQINLTLDFAKIEAKQLRAELAPGNLDRVLGRMMKAAQGYADVRGIRLSYVGGERVPESIFDAEKVETILANLLSNALKFTPRGGEVALTVASDAGRLTVEVRDTGEGIPGDQLERIFDPFHQVEGGVTRRHEGTGLGLALARELASLHGGSVSVESTLGVGSCFRFVLPQQPPSAEERRQEPRRKEDRTVALRRRGLLANEYEQAARRRALFSDLTAPRLSVSASPTLLGPKAPHVLLVEDNDDLRAFLQQSLHSRFVVETARNGVEALARLATDTPDLIIADVMMPQMDGYTLCRRLRADPAWAGVPVILLTARTGAPAVVEGLTAGANDYIAKPFDVRELEARIDVQLRLHTLERSLSERDKRLALIGQMTSSIAHDLNNPLAALVLLSDHLKLNTDLDDSARRHVVNIDAQTERLIGMVRDICDFAKLGTVTLQLRETPFAALVQEIGLAERARLKRLDIELQIDVDQASAEPVALDRERIRRVVENLLRNAKEALEQQDSGVKHISLSARSAPGGVELRVADSGPGVRAEIRDHLFEPFVTDGKPNGTGLGLAIVHDLVAAHGGTIELADTEAGGGAVFRMWLPRGGPAT